MLKKLLKITCAAVLFAAVVVPTPSTLNAAVVPTTMVYSTQVGVDVTTTSTEVLAANTVRRWALIINDSDVVVYCKVGLAAVLNEFLRLNANGGSFEISNALENYNSAAINCIHGGTGNKVILVAEGV